MKQGPRWVLTAALLLATACSGLVPPAPAAPTAVSSPTRTATPSQTPSALPSPTHTPNPSATPTPTQTATSVPTPTPLVIEQVVVYRPEAGGRDVATVRWANSGSELIYALSPLKGRYLLDWFGFDFNNQTTRTALSPYPAFGTTWERMSLGYPANDSTYAELQGFVSPAGKYLLFPNAGFPNVFTTPNYIYVIPTESGVRQPLIGPTFRGTVGKAAWLDHETKVIFDYRYANGLEVFVGDLRRFATNLLLDLKGSEQLHSEWLVSPDQSALFVPGRGKSQIVSLTGALQYSFDSPFGMENPVWAQDSKAIYYWDGNEARLMRYTLGDAAPQPLLALYDLMSSAPVKVVRGMPFAVSPDEKQVAFWWKNWIWVVRLKPA